MIGRARDPFLKRGETTAFIGVEVDLMNKYTQSQTPVRTLRHVEVNKPMKNDIVTKFNDDTQHKQTSVHTRYESEKAKQQQRTVDHFSNFWPTNRMIPRWWQAETKKKRVASKS